MLTKQIRRTQRVHFRGMAARVLDIGCQISEFLRCPQKVYQKRIVLFQLLVFNFYADKCLLRLSLIHKQTLRCGAINK